MSELAEWLTPKACQMLGPKLNLKNLLRQLTDSSPKFHKSKKGQFSHNFWPCHFYITIISNCRNLSEIWHKL